jgi:virulence factor
VNAQARTRVAVIGAGNIATTAQLPTLAKRDDVELAALVSRRSDPEPLKRRWGLRTAYGTVEDMLSAENLDAVFVLTPRSEQADAVEACLRRYVDVYAAGRETFGSAGATFWVAQKNWPGSESRATWRQLVGIDVEIGKDVMGLGVGSRRLSRSWLR